MKNIIFINRYYYPDHSATAQILSDLAENLCANNFKISIITSRQLYNNPNANLSTYERVKGVTINRIYSTKFGRENLIGRSIDYLSFYFSLLVYLLNHTSKNDYLIAKTDPPLVSVIVLLAVKVKRAHLINWLQDLYPEVASKLKVKGLNSSILLNLITRARNWSLKHAKANVVLGKLMQERVVKITSNVNNTIIIPNWVIKQDIKSISRADNKLAHEWDLKDKFIVGYSGNLGKAHDHETLLNCVKLCSDIDDLIFLFIGNGAGYIKLKEICKHKNLENILFKDYQPLDYLSYSLSLPDVHLITLKPELEGLIVPSKFYGILAVGRPTIFIGDSQGEIAGIVNEYEVGITIPDKNTAELKRVIVELKSERACLDKMGEAARQLHLKHYNKTHSYNLWRSLLSA